MCPQERFVLIIISTGLYFAKKGLGHLLHLFVTFVTFSLFCCLIRKPLKICLLSIHRDFLLHTTVQHLLLLVGIDTPIYRKYCDTPYTCGSSAFTKNFEGTYKHPCTVDDL